VSPQCGSRCAAAMTLARRHQPFSATATAGTFDLSTFAAGVTWRNETTGAPNCPKTARTLSSTSFGPVWLMPRLVAQCYLPGGPTDAGAADVRAAELGPLLPMGPMARRAGLGAGAERPAWVSGRDDGLGYVACGWARRG